MLLPEIKDKCMQDAQLLANIASVVGKSPIATWQMINRNSSKQLESVHVIKVIAEYTGLSQEQILSQKIVEA